jgi:hypothetical protein
MLVLLMGGIYELRRCDGLRCHDMHTKFYEYIDWFSHPKVGFGWAHSHRQHCDLISLLLFSQNKENRLKMSKFFTQDVLFFILPPRFIGNLCTPEIHY